ncbi:Protein Smaug 1 [Liparis tanakae]|uniref:Protein Smaug 1 n=1 Tax=Liparis tanakae TaxID=230148 RepID=A0A4Z2DZW6_9TELE|nr:Protein Smaug 1 [Liparis tanakae]
MPSRSHSSVQRTRSLPVHATPQTMVMFQQAGLLASSWSQVCWPPAGLRSVGLQLVSGLLASSWSQVCWPPAGLRSVGLQLVPGLLASSWSQVCWPQLLYSVISAGSQ